MNITTRFSPGDRIWCTLGDGEPCHLTVGQVRVTLTDTPGLDLGDGINWDNFKACKGQTEEYMCVETGVGSGSIYELGRHAFATRAECEARIAEVQAELEREAKERELARQLDAVQGLLYRKPMLEYTRDE